MIYDMLYDFQKNIIDKNIDKKAYGIFIDMGLGKSPISLAFAEKHNSDKILIITTNAKALEDENIDGSFLNWISKADIKYNLYNKNVEFNSSKKNSKIITKDTKDVFVINYEALHKKGSNQNFKKVFMLNSQQYTFNQNLEQFLNSCKNNVLTIIVDESHKVKTKNSVRTKTLNKIYTFCKSICSDVYLYLLTGTPFTRGFEDLYTQLNLLGWDCTWTAFKEMFCKIGCIPSLEPYQQPIIGYKNIDKLFDLVHKYAVTIKSEEVLNLPEQIFVNHKLKQSKEMNMFTFKKLKVDFINKEFKNRNIDEYIAEGKKTVVNNPFYGNINYPDLEWYANSSSLFYLRARQLSIGFQGNEQYAKWFNKNRLEELEKLLTENEDNYILFYNYTAEFIELYELCERLNYKIDIYNGFIKSEVHYENFKKLSEEEKLVERKRIILVNYASGSTAKNWQAYNKCILFSLPIFSDYQQAIKRIHRIGQKNAAIYHIFYEDNWLDSKMLKSLYEKKEYDEKMFINDLAELQNNI